jgi:hypothetical protein
VQRDACAALGISLALYAHCFPSSNFNSQRHFSASRSSFTGHVAEEDPSKPDVRTAVVRKVRGADGHVTMQVQAIQSRSPSTNTLNFHTRHSPFSPPTLRFAGDWPHPEPSPGAVRCFLPVISLTRSRPHAFPKFKLRPMALKNTSAGAVTM